MEVYVEPERMPELRKKWKSQKSKLNEQKKPAFLQTSSDATALPVFLKSIAHSMDKELAKMGDQSCFNFFNPSDEKVYNTVVKKWSRTLMALSMKGSHMPKESEVEDSEASSMLQKTAELPLGHVFRVAAMVLLLVGVWFLWQRFSHLFTKNKEVEAAPLAQPMGPIQVSD